MSIFENTPKARGGTTAKDILLLAVIFCLALSLAIVSYKALLSDSANQTIVYKNDANAITTDQVLENFDKRISDIWASIQAIGLISSIIGVLITVLVLYFSFANSTQISAAIAAAEKKSDEIDLKIETLTSRLKKEMREASIEFRMEMERRISEEDAHQKSIETRLNQIQADLNREIKTLEIETNIQRRLLDARFEQFNQKIKTTEEETIRTISGVKHNALNDIEQARKNAIFDIKNPGDEGRTEKETAEIPDTPEVEIPHKDSKDPTKQEKERQPPTE